MTMKSSYLSGVSRFKQACIRFDKGFVVYVDPFGIEGEAKDADYIFITHTHHDHYSVEDIKKVAKDETVFVAPADVAALLGDDLGVTKIKVVGPLDILSLGSMCVEVIPSYNTDKNFHPKENGWVGYVLRMDDGSYYIPGDTDATDEFTAADADVFFVPIGGTYTMNIEEAAAAVNKAAPKIAVPMHYGDLEGVGTKQDGEKFIALLINTKGVIL